MERPPAALEPHAPTAADPFRFPGAGNDAPRMTPQHLGRTHGGTVGLAWMRVRPPTCPMRMAARSPEDEVRPHARRLRRLLPLVTLLTTGVLTAYGLRYLRD